MRDTQNYASIPPEPASNDQSLAALATSLGAGIVLPTDISTLCWELRVLAAYITRDNPDYQEVHSKLKELKHHIEIPEPNSMPEASPEVLQSIHPILARRIESLESSLCCVTEAFGGPPLLQQTAGTTYSDRVKFLTSAVCEIFNPKLSPRYVNSI